MLQRNQVQARTRLSSVTPCEVVSVATQPSSSENTFTAPADAYEVDELQRNQVQARA